MYLLGFDIGGTKCAVITAEWNGEQIKLLKKDACATDFSVPAETMLQRLMDMADAILDGAPEAVGVSCGGPLDSERGVILCPPNLKGWVNIPVCAMLEAHYHVPVRMENDANACAVAEWKFGAGRGTRNMIFLTFGTGLGAGLILDGKLYSGTNDNAGEVGHIRLAPDGPLGFGKRGSFEGFCSGGGLAQLGYQMALESLERGVRPAYFPEDTTPVTAKSVADAAHAGDATALEVYRVCGEYLGRGLSILVDVLNPERIVIGSVFARSRDLLWQSTKRVMEEEALSQAYACCEVVPAALSENIGDYAAIAAALNAH